MTEVHNSWKHLEEKVFCCHHALRSMCFLYHFPSYSWGIIAKLCSPSWANQAVSLWPLALALNNYD